MPELWGPILGARPSPLVPPFDLSLGDETYTFAQERPLIIAASIATMSWETLIPGMLIQSERVYDRLDDDDDPLTDTDVEVAACVAATRLCSIGDGLAGWRRSVWMCQAIIGGWEQIVGALFQNGIDPSVEPLWKTCALVWRLAVVDGDEDGRADRAAKLSRRLPGEAAARRSSHSGEAPFDRREMTKAFMAKVGGGQKAGTERIASARRDSGPGSAVKGGSRASRASRASRIAAAKARAQERKSRRESS